MRTTKISRKDAITLLTCKEIQYAKAPGWSNAKLAKTLNDLPEFQGIEDDMMLSDPNAQEIFTTVMEIYHAEDETIVVEGKEPEGTEAPRAQPAPNKPAKTEKTKPASKKPTAAAKKPTTEDKAKAAAKKAKDRAPHGLGLMEQAHKLLTSTKKPMNAKQMIEELAARKMYVSPNGKTPWDTLKASIIRDIQKGPKVAKFQKVAPGVYGIAGIKYDYKKPVKAKAEKPAAAKKTAKKVNKVEKDSAAVKDIKAKQVAGKKRIEAAQAAAKKVKKPASKKTAKA